MKVRACLLAVGLALALAAPGLAVDHPVAGDSLLLRDSANPSKRKLKFRAAKDPAIDPAQAGDPRSVGATLEVRGESPEDGAAGPITLGTSRWTGLGNPPGSGGYRWFDRDRTNGVRKVIFKSGPAGGLLKLSGGGAAWPYQVTQAQGGPIDVRFTVGAADVYCAQFTTFRRNEPGRVSATDAPAPPDCGGAPPASSTTTTSSPGTSTTTTTVPGTCGNGVLDGAEECDDGNTANGDGCTATCELESVNPALCAGVPTVSGTAIATVLFQSGFTTPVHVAAPRLDPSRVFVVEQTGRIKMVKNGVVTTFLDIVGKVASGGERGLLSVAFDPDYETNGFFYVYYTLNALTPLPDGNLIIARYHATSPDLGDAASETVLLTIPHTSQPNHNGGNLNFGPDGFLYAATGDGGGGGDPDENAQNDLSMLGKLLRINPGTGATTNWAKGLRNPFRFSFDRANGDIYIGDVGQGRWEEIDYTPGNASGVNYGWDDMEGRHCFEPSAGCLTAGRQLPVLEYCNSAFSDPACSTFQPEKGQAVTGGFVYRGCRMPDLRGRYFYSDFYTAFIRSFMGVSGGDAQSLQNHTAALDPPGTVAINNVSSFGEDARGELYIADYDGEIFKIVPGS
jgi:hypothetical protein